MSYGEDLLKTSYGEDLLKKFQGPILPLINPWEDGEDA
jgi:hypothetical protein